MILSIIGCSQYKNNTVTYWKCDYCQKVIKCNAIPNSRITATYCNCITIIPQDYQNIPHPKRHRISKKEYDAIVR